MMAIIFAGLLVLGYAVWWKKIIKESRFLDMEKRTRPPTRYTGKFTWEN